MIGPLYLYLYFCGMTSYVPCVTFNLYTKMYIGFMYLADGRERNTFF